MADLSHINGKAIGDISHFNGKAIGDIASINGLLVPAVGTLSVSPQYINVGPDEEEESSYVTSTGAWTASVIGDPDSLLADYDSSGSGSEWFNFSTEENGEDETGEITIRITLDGSGGAIYDTIYICVSGQLEECDG